MMVKAWNAIETSMCQLCKIRLPAIKRLLYGPQADKLPNEKITDYVTRRVARYQACMDAGDNFEEADADKQTMD
jgi:hypothetical protein